MGLVDLVKRFIPTVEVEKTGRAVEAEWSQETPSSSAMGKDQPRGRGTIEDYLNTYGVHTWTYVCVNRIMSSCGQVPIKVWKRDLSKVAKGEARIVELSKREGMEQEIEVVKQEVKESWEEVVDPKNPLVAIFTKPNPYMSWQQYNEYCTASEELAGNSYSEVVSEGGVPVELYPMLPQRVKIVPDPKTYIKSYLYEVLGQRVTFSSDEVLHFKTMNPKDHYYGQPAMRVAENAIIVDVYASVYNKAFFKNSAIPAGVLQTDQELSPAVVRRIKREWSKLYQGPSKAFFLAVLEQGLKYQGIFMTNRDMQFQQLKEMNRDELFAIYGIPPVVGGIVKNANYSLANQQWKQYWAETITPKLKRKESILNLFFVPRFGDPDLYAEFDTEGIMATRQDEESEARISATYTDRGILTINEVRKKKGLTPVSWGDTWMMPMNQSPAGGQTQIGGHEGLQPGMLGAENPGSIQGIYPSTTGIGKTVYVPADLVMKLIKGKGNNGGAKLLQDGSVAVEDTELSPFQKAKLSLLLDTFQKRRSKDL